MTQTERLIQVLGMQLLELCRLQAEIEALKAELAVLRSPSALRSPATEPAPAGADRMAFPRDAAKGSA